jgi:outer membrane immunogenic protein
LRVPERQRGLRVAATLATERCTQGEPAFNEHIAASVALGGGVESAFWYNWSAKIEYDFYDFSTLNLLLPGTIFGVPEVVPGVNVKETISTVKFGIDYRFGTY